MGDTTSPAVAPANSIVSIDPAELEAETTRIKEERYVAIYTEQRTLKFFLGVVALGIVFGVLPLIPAVQRVVRVSPLTMAIGLVIQVGMIGLATLAGNRPGGVATPLHRVADRAESFTIAAVTAALIRLSNEPTSVFWLISIMHAFFAGQDVLHAGFTRRAHALSLGLAALSFAVVGRIGDGIAIVVIATIGLFLASAYEKGVRETIVREAERAILRGRFEKLLVEKERGRIARDLHDGLGAQLAAIAWSADALAGEEGAEISQRARASMTELREVVRGLKKGGSALPLAVVTASLERAVKDLAGELAHQVRCEGDATLSANLQTELTAMVREAVRNAIQHAGAKRIDVLLVASGGRLTVRVEDDGKGFPARAVETSTGGLSNLQERASALGGTASFASANGARVTVDLPLP